MTVLQGRVLKSELVLRSQKKYKQRTDYAIGDSDDVAHCYQFQETGSKVRNLKINKSMIIRRWK